MDLMEDRDGITLRGDDDAGGGQRRLSATHDGPAPAPAPPRARPRPHTARAPPTHHAPRPPTAPTTSDGRQRRRHDTNRLSVAATTAAAAATDAPAATRVLRPRPTRSPQAWSACLKLHRPSRGHLPGKSYRQSSQIRATTYSWTTPTRGPHHDAPARTFKNNNPQRTLACFTEARVRPLESLPRGA